MARITVLLVALVMNSLYGLSNYASCLTTSCSLSTASKLMIAELDTIFNQVMNAAVNGNYGIRSISANYNLPKITSG